jgi:ankyrin repeat protein
LDEVYDKDTALTVAARRGFISICRALLAKGANKNHPNHRGYTPLIEAARGGYMTCVRCLCKAGADMEDGCTGHMTPLMSAAFAGKIASVKYLLAAGAWKDHRNFFGRDAEFYAKDQGHHEIVELLQQAK